MAALPYTVDVSYPFHVQVIGYDGNKPVFSEGITIAENAWCDAEAQGEWTHEASKEPQHQGVGLQMFDADGNQTYGYNLSFWTWSFELERDATLFKLFWGGSR